MNNLDFLFIFILLDFVGICHIFIIKKNLLNKLNKPLNTKLFGANKTWRGLFVMSFGSLIFGFLYFGLLISFLLGFLWILGELPNSYIKRKLNILPGKNIQGGYFLIQYIFDVLDSIILIIIFLYFGNYISISKGIVLILLGFINHSLIDLISIKIGIKKNNFPNPIIILIQIFCWFIFQVYFLFKLDIKKIKIKNIKNKNIIISNHIRFLDPFLICGKLSFLTFFYLLPIRFMITPNFIEKPILGKILISLGGYNSKIIIEGKNNTLKLSQKFLLKGESIFIFPQGGITKKQIKVGAFYLNKKIENSNMLLFKITKNNINFIGKDNIKNYNENDLLNIGKLIFNKIEDEY